jgi:hypothetical protein
MIHHCLDLEYPDIEYSLTPEKNETGRYIIHCSNVSYEDDLLFQTPILMLDRPLTADDVEISVVGDVLEPFFDMLKEDHIHKAIENRDKWFKGKNISEELLPDLWKDSVKKGRAKFQKGDDPEEPFAVYKRNGEDMTDSLPSGCPVILLIRLEGLWISRGNLGSSFTVVQAMDMRPEERKPISKISKCNIVSE